MKGAVLDFSADMKAKPKADKKKKAKADESDEEDGDGATSDVDDAEADSDEDFDDDEEFQNAFKDFDDMLDDTEPAGNIDESSDEGDSDEDLEQADLGSSDEEGIADGVKEEDIEFSDGNIKIIIVITTLLTFFLNSQKKRKTYLPRKVKAGSELKTMILMTSISLWTLRVTERRRRRCATCLTRTAPTSWLPKTLLPCSNPTVLVPRQSEPAKIYQTKTRLQPSNCTGKWRATVGSKDTTGLREMVRKALNPAKKGSNQKEGKVSRKRG